MSQVTQEYLDGIREGREYFNRFKPDLFDMHSIMANIELTLRRRFSREVSDVLKGERDFWKNQIKLKGN